MYRYIKRCTSCQKRFIITTCVDTCTKKYMCQKCKIIVKLQSIWRGNHVRKKLEKIDDDMNMHLLLDCIKVYIDTIRMERSINEKLSKKKIRLSGFPSHVSENIVKAIRTVLSGEIYVSNTISKKFLHKIAADKLGTTKTTIENLSDREFEIFRLIAEGHRASQIAKKLYLSVKTVDTYRGRLKEKLNLDSANELLQYAIKWAKSQDQE